MLHFGLAYFLQQKLDSEFFAIIDVPNKPKKMFEDQQLVKFQKTWYYHDLINKTAEKPDLEYLASFEKKYGFNLWKLAINERHFYRFNRFYKFSYYEILKFLEQECKLFEKILDEIKPDYFLTYDPPFHHQKLLLDMCKAKGIKVLCIYYARIGGNSVIGEDGGTLDLPQNLEMVKLNENEDNQISKDTFNETEKQSKYASLTKTYQKERGATQSDQLKALKDYILYSDSGNTESNYTYYGRTKLRVILDSISMMINRKLRSNFMNRYLKKTVELNLPFVYFPLNVEEELSILHYSPYNTNQIEVIRHVARSIPIDYLLYVKDHIFSGFRGWREIDEYKEIMDIPNVVLIHPSYSNEKLIKHSKLVVTVRGTGSFDALYENKPSIVFGNVPFSTIPSVYKVDDITELPKLIKTALQTPVDPIYLQKYIKLIKDRSVDFSMMDFEVKRNNQFYSGNTLSDVEISESSTKQFFENNKGYFEPLVNAHLEIINEE